ILAAGARIGGIGERPARLADRESLGNSRGDLRVRRPTRELQDVELLPGRGEECGQVAGALPVLQPELLAAVRHRPDLAVTPEGLGRLVAAAGELRPPAAEPCPHAPAA